MSQIVTANRLSDGAVVFLAPDGWNEDFNRAFVAETKEAVGAALARAAEDEAQNKIVEPYAVEVEARNGHYAPKALREAIRAAGPTVRRDLGKQALGYSPIAPAHPEKELSHVSL